MRRDKVKQWLPAVFAATFALFHLLTVTWTLVTTGGAGEGQAFTVLLFDWPLVILLDHVPRGGYILYGSVTMYVWFFSIAGTAMYAVIGYLLGTCFTAVWNRVGAKDRAI